MPRLLKEIVWLIRKDLLLEWRQRYALNGLLLYVSATIMVVYMSVLQLKPATWMAMLWIILLFVSVNAIAKSFLQESAARQLYYYTLVQAEAVILSKILYNTVLLLVISLLAVLAYSIVLGNPVQHKGLFFWAIVLGAVSFSNTFTLVASIAAKAGSNQSMLMPILSFPIIIPIIALLLSISTASITGKDSNFNNNLQVLLTINIILPALSYILFPYLWRE
ncbi:MAG: cytochrome C biogenesis protein [Chitinophagales bacterium]|nr:ABC transporter permease [Bacteroidota bacterium]MCB9043593.1 ABC transporter permease [Chitinophagales bacterium]